MRVSCLRDAPIRLACLREATSEKAGIGRNCSPLLLNSATRFGHFHNLGEGAGIGNGQVSQDLTI